MPEDFRLIVDLVLVLAAATIGGLLASLLRQPAILGYLIGGIIVGPGGLGVIKELIQVETLAQFGVAFLLFALGVEFSFAELKKSLKITTFGLSKRSRHLDAPSPKKTIFFILSNSSNESFSMIFAWTGIISFR